MTIFDIYKNYKIPPNLQEHMLRVASIIEYLQKHWNSDIKVDWELALKVALLHDLGNIIKFDFDKHPEFLGDEQKNIDYWKTVQSEFISKYGNDDDKATKTIISELGIDNDVAEIIFKKRFSNSVEVEKSNNWILKLLYYADLRTLPFGIGTLEDRIEDVRSRMPKYTSRPDFEDLVNACFGIGKQIEVNLDISPNEVNDNNIGIRRNLLKFEV